MTNQEIHDAQKVYVTELEKTLDWPKEQLWDLARKLWPTIETFSQDNTRGKFRITMSPLMNTLAALGCGDLNASFHTGTGCLQTLPLVGMCSAITSTFRPGYALRKIAEPVEFKAAVPIGSPVIMTTEQTRKQGPFCIFKLQAVIEACGTEIFETNRTLTMREID